ncbi:MAG: ASCH domain-containing protein [Spirochaetales bacterium]|jgi:hypothetical protein|nr:ASCH domain-containing protein [Spirochaetales bacterium]
MKTLSIRQPYAALVCRGIKKAENRPWETSYRGKLFIHASGKPLAWPKLSFCTDAFVKDYYKYYGTDSKNTPVYIKLYMKWVKELYQFYHFEGEMTYSPPVDKLKDLIPKYGYALPTQAIIGEVDLVDIVVNSRDVFASPGDYHWVFENQVLYEKPILNVMGKLRLWDYEK